MELILEIKTFCLIFLRSLLGKAVSLDEDSIDSRMVLIEDPAIDPLIRENFNLVFLNTCKRIKNGRNVINDDSRFLFCLSFMHKVNLHIYIFP